MRSRLAKSYIRYLQFRGAIAAIIYNDDDDGSIRHDPDETAGRCLID